MTVNKVSMAANGTKSFSIIQQVLSRAITPRQAVGEQERLTGGLPVGWAGTTAGFAFKTQKSFLPYDMTVAQDGADWWGKMTTGLFMSHIW